MLAGVENGECTKLVSHMARANPQWQDFSSSTEVLSVFTGPHAYISPSWYTTDQAVPTWNYAAVHIYGYPRIINDPEEVVACLDKAVAFFERTAKEPWTNRLPEDLQSRLINAIVAFEITVTRTEGVFKLGQNRSAEDLNGVHNALSKSTNQQNQQIADLMSSEGLIKNSPNIDP